MTETIHIVICMKPVDGTFVDNALKHGVAGLNIDRCRIPHITVAGGSLAYNPHLREKIAGGCGGNIIAHEEGRRFSKTESKGRFPANVIHDGSEEVVNKFPFIKSFKGKPRIALIKNQTRLNNSKEVQVNHEYCDSGSAARFFAQYKPDGEQS